MISIIKKKRSANLYVQFHIDGKCVQRSTKLEDTPKNRKFIESKIIPSLALKIANGEFNQKRSESKFDYFATKYLKAKDDLKTYDQLSSVVNNQILPVFSGRDVLEIKRYEVKEFADNKLQHVTPKRVRHLVNVLAGILDIAIDYEVLTHNVAKNIQLPKHKKKDLEPFSQNEVNTILSSADGWFKTFLSIAFFTGARTGEILALNWNDINFEDGVIHITKSLRNGVIGSPKTESSVRDVPMFDELKKELLLHRSRSKTIYLFANPNTGNMFYKTAKLTPYWSDLLKKCNISHRILYATRHTFISSMLKYSDLSMLDIAQIVGHSNTEMIVRNYAKYIKGEHLKISKKLNIFTDNSTDTSLESTNNTGIC